MAISAVTFISKDANHTIINNDVLVLGNRGNESINIKENVKGIIAGSNIENMSLSGNFSDYQTVILENSGFQVRDLVDNVIVSLASLNVNMSVKFADQTLALLQTGSSSFSLGGESIRVISETTAASTTVKIDINTDGKTVDAGDSVATIYKISAGQYSHTIDGFSAGDVLDIFDGGIFNVSSDENNTDGIQEFTVTNTNAQTVTLTLTGLSIAEDEGLFNKASFDTVFGTGVII